MKSSLIIVLALFLSMAAHGQSAKTTEKLLLGETAVTVNVYEKPGADVTFFAPHYNETSARLLALEFVEKNGGRLVEIESRDERGRPARNVQFVFAGKKYSVDPNRIYTPNGRRCNMPYEAQMAGQAFAEKVLSLVIGGDGKSLRSGEKFVVAVHNNTDASPGNRRQSAPNLTAVSFLKSQSAGTFGHGVFAEQADGVFLSNEETDEDNFILLSSPMYINHFARRGFNIVIQKPASRLQTIECKIDDGSLSVYAASVAIQYVCLEADATTGDQRQRKMLEAVYDMFEKTPVPVSDGGN